MEKPLYESLMSIKKNYDQLFDKLSSPEIVNDVKKYQQLSREINNIKDIATTFDQYLKLVKTIEEAKEIINNEVDNDLLIMAKQEIAINEPKIPKIIDQLKILILPKDKNDQKDVIIEIRGAAGGDEANIFAGDLLNIYKKWAILNSMQLKILNEYKSESGGYSMVTFRIEGENAYSKLKFETGVHRVQRVPETETMGRIHTSTSTVTVMPEADESVEIEINPTHLKIDTYRASGAGGQHVNKTDSAVRITHLPSGIVAQSQEGRSQIHNRDLAMTILRTKLYEQEVRKQEAQNAAFRKLAGTGARSEKIRTYNYPQNRVTDHRINFSVSLETILSGKIDVLINALLAAEHLEKIKEAGF